MTRAKLIGITGFCMAIATTPGRLALAQGSVPDCSTLTNTVYMAGTTAVIPVIRLFGARLKKVGVTLLWNENSEGCSSAWNLTYPPPPGGALSRDVYTQYTEDPNQPGKVYPTTCNSKLGQIPDLVINDVGFSSCSKSYQGGGVFLPAGFAEFSGPVQGLVPIVASSYTYYNDITAEELQNLYVCGGKGGILTFTVSSSIFDYNCVNSGMRELFARGIGFPNAASLSPLVGQGCNNTITAETMVTNNVGPATSPDTTIGYTSTEFYDQYRNLVRGLKVRGVNQKLGYWPDSSMTSTDKLNVREGRYTLQGTLRLVAAVDGNGVPTNPAAKEVIDWFQGNPVDPSLQLPFDINEIYASGGVVPQCAMKVTKDGDLPVFKHYYPAQPCHCSYEILATGKTSIPGCVACSNLCIRSGLQPWLL